MARRVFSRPLRQGQRRKTEWVQSADVTSATVIGAGAATLLQSISEASLLAQGLQPSTVIRTRGYLFIQSDQDAAAETSFGALSFAVCSEPARAAGVASLLTPLVDEDADQFFVYESWQAFSGGPSTGALFSQPTSVVQIDSKAQRKVSQGDAIVVVMEIGHSAHGAQMVLKFRMLFKLH